MGVLTQSLVPVWPAVHAIRRGRIDGAAAGHLRPLTGECGSRPGVFPPGRAHRPERDDSRQAGHRVSRHPEYHGTAQCQRFRMESSGECRRAARATRRVPAGRSRMAISRRAGTTIVTMTPPLHKLALTAHVTSSIGWLGAVGSFLALAIAGLIGNDDAMVRAVYVATEVTTWVVIVS